MDNLSTFFSLPSFYLIFSNINIDESSINYYYYDINSANSIRSPFLTLRSFYFYCRYCYSSISCTIKHIHTNRTLFIRTLELRVLQLVPEIQYLQWKQQNSKVLRLSPLVFPQFWKKHWKQPQMSAITSIYNSHLKAV